MYRKNKITIGLTFLLMLMMSIFVSAELVDVTNYNSDNTCVTEQNNFKINTLNCNVISTSNTHKQYIEFEWSGVSPITTDWFFRFDESLTDYHAFIVNEILIDNGNISRSEETLTNIDHLFSYVGNNVVKDGKYYKISGVNFVSNQKYKIKLVYTSTENEGKYDIFGKLSNDDLLTAINNNRYIFQDPTFGTSFSWQLYDDVSSDSLSTLWNLSGSNFVFDTDHYENPNVDGDYNAQTLINTSYNLTGLMSDSTFDRPGGTWGGNGFCLGEGFSSSIGFFVNDGWCAQFSCNGDDLLTREIVAGGVSSTDTQPFTCSDNVERSFKMYFNNSRVIVSVDDVIISNVSIGSYTPNNETVGHWYAQMVGTSDTIHEFKNVYVLGIDNIIAVNMTYFNTTFSQEPSDVTEFNNIDVEVNATINFTGTVNTSSVKLWYSLVDKNNVSECMQETNGTCIANSSTYFEIENKTIFNNTDYNFIINRSFTLPAKVNFNATADESTNYSLYNTHAIIQKFENIELNKLTRFGLNFFAWFSGLSAPLDVYVCNTLTYDTSLCHQLDSFLPSGFHVKQTTFTMNSSNYIADYEITTNNMYVLIETTSSLGQPWSLRMQDFNSGKVWEEVGGLPSKIITTNFLILSDILNQDYMTYFINGTSLDGSVIFNSTLQEDRLLAGNTPPQPFEITSPTLGEVISQNLIVDHEEAIDLEGDVITYSATVINGEITVIDSSYLYAEIPFISDLSVYDLSAGNYILVIEACDPSSACRSSTQPFTYTPTVDPSQPVTVNIDLDNFTVVIILLVVLVLYTLFLVSSRKIDYYIIYIFGSFVSLISAICMTLEWQNTSIKYIFLVPLVYGLFWLSEKFD